MSKPSPFEQVHLQLGAEMADYSGWRLPKGYGQPNAESDALNNHCAAFDLSGFGRLGIKGEDAVKLLTKMGLSVIPDRGCGQWAWTQNGSRCRHRIASYKSEYVLLSEPGQMLMAELKAIADSDKMDVQLIDMSEKTAFLGLYGPAAFQSISKVLPFEIDELEPGGVMPVSFFMMNFILFRGSWLDGEGLELICPVSAAGLVGGSIMKYRQKYNITPAGMDCLLEAMAKKG